MILSNSLSTYYQPKENKLNGYGSEWWYKTNIGTKRIPRMIFLAGKWATKQKKHIPFHSIAWFLVIPWDSYENGWFHNPPNNQR